MIVLLLMLLSIVNILVLILTVLHLRKESKVIRVGNPTQAKIWAQKARIVAHNKNRNDNKPFENPKRRYYAS